MTGGRTECGNSPRIMSTPTKMANTVTSSTMNNLGSVNSAPATMAASSTATSPINNITNNKTSISHNLPPRQGSARERALHAVEYYNSNVLRVRVGAGLTARSSVNERHLMNARNAYQSSAAVPSTGAYHRIHSQQRSDNMYRSNSSLELMHNETPSNGNNSNGNNGLHLERTHPVPGLRREYGSHGSIDALASTPPKHSRGTSESFFAMLQDYRPAVLGVIGTDQRSPGPVEYMKGKVVEQTTVKSSTMTHTTTTTANNTSLNSTTTHTQQNFINESLSEDSIDRGSPKLRNKLQRLWGQSKQTRSMSIAHPVSITNGITEDCCVASTLSADMEERQKRRAFAHYDCQSLAANLGYAAKLRGVLLARRRNTTTGASAASMLNTRSSTPDSAQENVDDYGDGQSNELLESCPFFRNEVGGEEEREVSLTRFGNNMNQKNAIHRPALAYGVSILESEPNEALWKDNTCPFQRTQRPIESVDIGARYYRKYFFGQEHQHFFGMDEQLGPVAISIKREKLPETLQQQTERENAKEAKDAPHLIRMIVRTSELLTLRGSVVEDSIPSTRGAGKPATTKDIIEYVAPDIQLSCLRQGVNTPQCEQQLLKLDEQGLTNKYKVGILYCRAGQSTEEDMYNNEEAGPAFTEFLQTIGKTVCLKGFDHYKAGLDNKTDSTGTHSLYATYQDCEIMFHVSTMLPFTPNNRQQLLRKRHIGNDIVTIVFQEPGSMPFTPKNIRSQFQHVFVVVRAINPCTDHTQYKVSVSRSKEVPVFGPPIRGNAIYSKGKTFMDFLLAKIINAENAAHRSEKFATMATRTRQEYLKDLATNYITTAMIESGSKFSIFSAGKKKERQRPKFNGSAIQRGAFCWQVILHDGGQFVDAFLGISHDTFVLMEECSRQIVFVTPCRSILGWSTNGFCIRIYHHQSECITLSLRESAERDEQLEVIERLRAVTPGCGAIELNLRRNQLGQLGFHVQPDGVVTQVEQQGQAWSAGLRQGHRLVEICKVAVATLSHDEMVDLLKTSTQVTVTVIESHKDHSPRRGCFYPQCKFNIINYEIDYDLDEPSKKPPKHKSVTHSSHRRFERNFSPPRSSNSSGYGTGSSSRSFGAQNNENHPNTMRFISGNGHDHTGTLTSSSSGHSSNDDRWYEILEVPDDDKAKHQQRYQKSPQYAPHPKLINSNSVPINNSRPLSIHDPKLAAYGKMSAPRSANSNGSDDTVHSHEMQHARNILKNTSPEGSQLDNCSIEPIYNLSRKSNEDELGNGIQNMDISQLKRSSTASSVQKPKSNGTVSSSASNSSSRNNSPRPLTEARLRPGVTNRNLNHLQQRNSVNYTNSTLQEDLMKLINPDYNMTSNDDNFHNGGLQSIKAQTQKNAQNSHSLGNIAALNNGLKPMSVTTTDDIFLMRKKSRSREGINLGSHTVPISADLKIKNTIENSEMLHKTKTNGSNPVNDSDIILTTARPATVISSTNVHSPSKEENVLHIHEDINPTPRRMTASNVVNNNNNLNNKTTSANGQVKKSKENDYFIPPRSLPLIPDTKDVDWSSLVDSAITQINEGLKKHYYESGGIPPTSIMNTTNGNQTERQHGNNSPSYESLSSTSSTSSSSGSANRTQSSLPDLQNQVTQLEDRITKETKRRVSLEHAVRKLTEENRRLQDESQAAVQQLRRFSEWFFQTIDRQT
ncbi:signal-induced proliferation-associated 1-like protein 2 isoform X2 [Contarinia nasturtii]|nr:signal-induced proliferation-associated 1-like protein 2 isoform X2 [Contarinia nasturtii]